MIKGHLLVDVSSRQCEIGIPNCRRPRRRIWRVTLQARPRSEGRTRSPAAVSQSGNFPNVRRRLSAILLCNVGNWSPETDR